MNDMLCESTFISDFMTLCFVFGGGIGIALAVVGYVTKTYDSDSDDDDDKEIREYERAYYTEFKAMEEKDHTTDFLNELGNQWIHEETPSGEIYMTYKADHESFWYFVDDKTVPYKTLDAVARRFALEHDCKSICINYKEQFEQGKKKLEDKGITEDKEGKEDKPTLVDSKGKKIRKSPFATFKSYNLKKSNVVPKKYIITKNANSFTYKGPVSAWVDPNLPKESVEEKKPDYSYSAFRRGIKRD